MKIYLAAKYGRRAEIAEYARQANAAGLTVTSTWLYRSEDLQSDTDAVSARLADDARDWSLSDLEDIRAADVLVCFADDKHVRGGKHFETGYAYAIGKRIVIVGAPELTFHRLPFIDIVPSWEAFLIPASFWSKVASND